MTINTKTLSNAQRAALLDCLTAAEAIVKGCERDNRHGMPVRIPSLTEVPVACDGRSLHCLVAAGAARPTSMDGDVRLTDDGVAAAVEIRKATKAVA